MSTACMRFSISLFKTISVLLCLGVSHALAQPLPEFTPAEQALIASFNIDGLGAPTDPSNAYLNNVEAAGLGRQLFFDTRMSANGQVACATCHLEDYEFTDPAVRSSGLFLTRRHAMTVVGAAYSPWQFWDGRADALWTQALMPIESPEEHGSNRTHVAHLVAEHYAAPYEAIFGALPALQDLPPQAGPVRNEKANAAWQAMSVEQQQKVNGIYANVGKAIAAFEATLKPSENRVDELARHMAKTTSLSAYRASVPEAQQLSTEELAGLKLFVGKAQCARCHFGPLYSNFEFFNTGVPLAENLPFDAGRVAGAQKVAVSEFNCFSEFSDAEPSQCDELRYLRQKGEELIRAYKVGSLRNIAKRPPYMHNGVFQTLAEVLRHYNSAPQPDVAVGHTELQPLKLTPAELGQLEAFLEALSGP